MTGRTRPLTRLLTVLGLPLLLVMSGLASPATARSVNDEMVADNNVKVRLGPATWHPQMGTVYEDERVEMLCQDEGESIRGNNVWYLVQYELTARPGYYKRGWVSASALSGTGRLKGIRWGDCPEPRIRPGKRIPRPPVQEQPSEPPPTSEPSVYVELIKQVECDPKRVRIGVILCEVDVEGRTVLAGWPRGDLHIEWIYTEALEGDPRRVVATAPGVCRAETACIVWSPKHEAEYFFTLPPEVCIVAKVSVATEMVRLSKESEAACFRPGKFQLY